MTYDVRLTAKAERQFKDAARWWSAHRSREQAGRWYDGFLAAIQSLSLNPERCPLARENASVPIEIRELNYGLGRRPTHRAIFAIRPGRVVVYSIRHQAQEDLTADDL
jgi:plasmid stabilization system protein ParE